MKLWQSLLYPFSLLYRGVTSARNALYDVGALASERFAVPVLVVGNLTAGGTGKTPHVQYLVRLLRKEHRLAVISRGYKRQTKGFRLAGPNETAATLGDEPLLYAHEFPDVAVAVGEKRPEAIKQVLALRPETDVVLLDDALQHRPVQGSFNLLLTDFGRLFYKDHVLPSGLLREARGGAARAQAVVVTKCPKDLPVREQGKIMREVHKYAGPKVPVFFSYYRYGQPVPLRQHVPLRQQVVLLTGIANPAPLRNYLQETGHQVVQEFRYPDHHHYSVAEMHTVRKACAARGADAVTVVTTAKDAVKLTAPELAAAVQELPVVYLPIEVAFVSGQAAFDALVRQAARTA